MEYKFVDNSSEVLELLKKATTRGLKAIGSTAEKYAKEKCPVDTGRLRNSIAYKSDDSCAIVGTNVEYAPDVELGTSKQKSQPYLKTAATEHSKEYEALLKESLKKA